MLVIFTGYDQVSFVLQDCALQLIKKAKGRVVAKVGPPGSNSAGVGEVLAKWEKITLFYFGHGELPPKGLVAQDLKPGVHAANLSLLKERLVLATSCYSAQSLAAAAKKHGATVLGYHGEMIVSFRESDRKLQEACVLAAALALLNGSDAAAAKQAAVDAFNDAAGRLIKGNAEDSVIASAVYRSNAQALRLAGKNRRI